MKKIVIIIAFLIVVPILFAASDPGHDTLYIEQEGDSELNGSLNITTNLKIDGNQTLAGLMLYGDGTTPSDPAYISGYDDTIDWLRIGTQGILYLNGDQVQVGTTLNVTGVIYEQNVRVCLANGTNCIGGNNTGNVSSVSAGNGISVSGTETEPIVSFDTAEITGCTGAGDKLIWDSADNRLTCGTDDTGGSGTVTGSSSGSGFVAYWDGASSITNTAGFTFDGSDLAVPGNLYLGTNAAINTTAGNLTITSATGYVIIDLG